MLSSVELALKEAFMRTAIGEFSSNVGLRMASHRNESGRTDEDFCGSNLLAGILEKDGDTTTR